VDDKKIVRVENSNVMLNNEHGIAPLVFKKGTAIAKGRKKK